MFGLIGLALSLSCLMYFAYRGINVLILAPLCATLAILFQNDLMSNSSQGLVLGYYTQVFMGALGKYLIQYFPIFLGGAIFGKLMNDTRAAYSIGHMVSRKLGSKHALLAIVLTCGVLTYGGVSLFVVAFCVYPISLALFNEAGIHKKFIPGAIALGSFTFTMTAFPGTPSIQNAIPMPFFGTTSFAAPGLGIIAGIIMLVLGLMWMNTRSKKYPVQKISSENPSVLPLSPPFALALTPLIIVIAANYVLSEILISTWDTSFLAQKIFGEIKSGQVKGLWALIISLMLSIAFILIFLKKYAHNFIQSLNEGTLGSLLPIFNTASEVGYGAVIAGLTSFTVLKNFILNLSPGNPLISEAIAINLLAGITGSASGGLSIGLQVLGAKYLEMAHTFHISPDLLHRVATLSSGGFDTLPHNGAVITLLAICGLTHRDSYLDIFMVAVAVPVVATIGVVILGSSFGSF